MVRLQSFKSHRDKVQINAPLTPTATNFSFKSHRDKVQIKLLQSFHIYFLEFQIPQGQSSNEFQSMASNIHAEFQIPQGQSSNQTDRSSSCTFGGFKSHRDKVQIVIVFREYLFNSSFQIPQGQSSNTTIIKFKPFHYCFKSHRDKVQILEIH